MEREVPLRITIVEPPPGVAFALRRGKDGLLPPTAEGNGEIAFDFRVRVGARKSDGGPNFLGPFTQGPPDTRFVYVNIGTSAGQTDSPWTRAAKVTLAGIDWQMIDEALAAPGAVIEARFAGSGKDGSPACATVPLLDGGWTVRVDLRDDDLSRFAAKGAMPLPESQTSGLVEHEGARIWYASYGAGPAVILLHGGLGHSGNWGYQVPALTGQGYQAIVIDSRGHGRSTRDERPFSYELMASDVLAVMEQLGIERAAVVGWSDGACVGMEMAARAAARVLGVFFFACNMDPSGTKEIAEFTPVLQRCFSRHIQDYQALSSTPDRFERLSEAVGLMQKSQPNYSANDLARIRVPVVIVQSEHDEFIYRQHAEYLAESIPGAELVILPEVSHFAPLQRPALFNGAMLAFISSVAG